jgi:hypothetical protein
MFGPKKPETKFHFIESKQPINGDSDASMMNCTMNDTTTSHPSRLEKERNSTLKVIHMTEPSVELSQSQYRCDSEHQDDNAKYFNWMQKENMDPTIMTKEVPVIP